MEQKNSFPAKHKINLALRALGVAALLFVLSARHAHAQAMSDPLILLRAARAATGIAKWTLSGITGLGSKIVTAFAFFLTSIINFILGLFIAFQTWVISILLQINNNVVGTAPVQMGFSVSLSVVNLGFVLAIIVIAIMTIFRSQTYGMKQALWRLVVAAILVNFSLVIAGTIINFSGSLTNYFMTSLPGQTGQGLGGALGFSTSLSAAFMPQQYQLPDNSGSSLGGGVVGKETQDYANAGAGIGQIIAPIASVLFSILNIALIVIVLGVFCFMLIVRYITLGILLILMPFAWLLWIFPSTRPQWSKWWNQFLRWTFFAPIVVFFLWLVIKTGEAIRNTSAGSPFSGVSTVFTSTSGGVIGSISTFFGGLFAPLMQTALNGFMLCGLTVGGLYAANKLSITGAGAGMAAAQGMAKWTGNRAGRYAKRGGARLLEKTGAEDRLNNAFKKRSSGTGLGARFMNKVRSGADYTTSFAARGLGGARGAGRESLVAEGGKDIQSMTSDSLVKSFGTLRIEQKFAAMDRLKREGRMHEIDPDYVPQQDDFNRFGQKKLWNDWKIKSAGAATPSSRNATKGLDEDKVVQEKRRDVEEVEKTLAKVEGSFDERAVTMLNRVDAFQEEINKAQTELEVAEKTGDISKTGPAREKAAVTQNAQKEAMRQFTAAGFDETATRKSMTDINGAREELNRRNGALVEAEEAVLISDYKRDVRGNFIDKDGEIIDDPWGKDKERLVKVDGVKATDVLRQEVGKALGAMNADQLRDIAPELFKRYKRAKPYLGLNEGAFESLQRMTTEQIALKQPGAITGFASKLTQKDFETFISRVINANFGVKEGDVLPASVGFSKPMTVEMAFSDPASFEKLTQALRGVAPNTAKALTYSLGTRLTGMTDLARAIMAAGGASSETTGAITP